MKKLTAKQEMFCREYLIDLNATQAAIRAGYSEKTAKDIACQNLAKLNVASFITKLKAERVETVSVSADYVLTRLYEIDQLDVLDIVSDDLSGFRPLNEWPKSWRISISAIDMKKMIVGNGDEVPIETIVEKIKWPDKTRNLELLGKHVNVMAFEASPESGSSSLADSVGKLIDRLPG